MPSRKEYEMLFQLNAELGKSFNSTFNKAQQELLEMQKEIQSPLKDTVRHIRIPEAADGC